MTCAVSCEGYPRGVSYLSGKYMGLGRQPAGPQLVPINPKRIAWMPPRGTRMRTLYGGPSFCGAVALVSAPPVPRKRTNIPIAENGTRVPFAPGTSTVHRTDTSAPGLAWRGSTLRRCACAPSFATAGTASTKATITTPSRRLANLDMRVKGYKGSAAPALLLCQ